MIVIFTNQTKEWKKEQVFFILYFTILYYTGPMRLHLILSLGVIYLPHT